MPRHALGGALIGISVLAAQVAAGKTEAANTMLDNGCRDFSNKHGDCII